MEVGGPAAGWTACLDAPFTGTRQSIAPWSDRVWSAVGPTDHCGTDRCVHCHEKQVDTISLNHALNRTARKRRLRVPSALPASVAFYRTVFGWSVRQRGDGSLAFDDGVGEVSGTWISFLRAALADINIVKSRSVYTLGFSN
jgi:hypothetical protein